MWMYDNSLKQEAHMIIIDVLIEFMIWIDNVSSGRARRTGRARRSGRARRTDRAWGTGRVRRTGLLGELS